MGAWMLSAGGPLLAHSPVGLCAFAPIGDSKGCAEPAGAVKTLNGIVATSPGVALPLGKET